MTTFFTVTLLTAVILGSLFGPIAYLQLGGMFKRIPENKRDTLSFVWGAVWICMFSGAIATIVTSNRSDGVHMWRGGAGADTVCAYEERLVYSKVPYKDIYTVCKDPR